MMRAAIRIGLQDILVYWRLALAMSLVIAVAVMGMMTLTGYREGLSSQFGRVRQGYLVIQESGIAGEIYGSHLPPGVEKYLRQKIGANRIIPEIHTVTGTSIRNAVLLRGIDLSQYNEIESAIMLSGAALEPGSQPRSAMIGYRLAERLNVHTGGQILLRGRAFQVTGVFQTSTFADNEAWISLSDAQELLGWREDVSIYILPDDGLLRAGDTLPGGVVVTQRGEGLREAQRDFLQLFDLLSLAAASMGFAAVLALTNVLLRLARLRRRQLAILRAAGFSKAALTGYLLSQALGIGLLGALLGGIATLLFSTLVRIGLFGFQLRPQYSALSILEGAIWMLGITLAGAAIPALWIGQANLAYLLKEE
jgi:ABC-type lipoprotein release transport system permease subunit